MQRTPKVMIVEDEVLSRDMITRRLERRGFVVEALSDGASCLRRLQLLGEPTGAPLDLPDLILLDIQMPGLNGLEVLEKVRAKHTHDALPVILVTALGDTDDIVRGLGAGANDYVAKPIVFPVLLARISVCNRIRESIALLMEAERQRVMISALGEACHQLSQPMQAVMMTLEGLIRVPPADAAEASEQLKDVLSWTQQVATVIHRLQEVGTMKTLPFVERMQTLQSGTPADQGERPR